MARAKIVPVLLALLALLDKVTGTAYFPATCAKSCGPTDFIKELSNVSIDDNGNRAFFWAAVALLQIGENLGQLSPPAAGRICGIVGTCLYEAAAMTREDLKSSVDVSYTFFVRGDESLLTAALDGAGFWAVRAIFGERDSFYDVFSLYYQVGDLDLRKLTYIVKAFYGEPIESVASLMRIYGDVHLSAAIVGAKACQKVIDKYTADGFEADGTLGGRPDPTSYVPVNAPQRLAGITDCDNEIEDPGAWQPLCVPSSSEDFGTTECKAQSFLAPFAGRFTTFALEEGDETAGGDLVGPPPSPGSRQFETEWREVLGFSATLDDVDKIIAEYWADGPDTAAPPGHWFKVAADAAITETLDQADTARLLFIVGSAVNDAGIASWRTKFTYDFIRPLQMIQCGAYRGTEMKAWRGPYMGVGLTNISEWRPFQASDFVTPGFPAYTSGHSTFSSAAAEALSLFFGDDTYRGPPCFRVKEGESLFEPRSCEMPGFSDVPNSGPETVGYVPREDVVLCWGTYTEASEQAGTSRFLGGIHVRADDVSGQSVGRKVGRDVFYKAHVLFCPTSPDILPAT